MNEQDSGNLSERAKVLAATGGVTKTPPEPPKKRRISDFFYHRKLLCAVIVFALILTVFSVWSFFSSGGPSDVTVMYAGPCTLYSDTGGALSSAIRSVRTSGKDKSISLTDITWYSENDIAELGGAYTLDEAENAAALSEFREELTNGDALFFLLSPELYAQVKESLVPLSEIFGEVPESAADVYSVRLGDTDFYKYFTAAQVLPENTRICMRRAADIAAYSEERAAEADALCRELFRDIVGFVSPFGSESSDGGEQTDEVSSDGGDSGEQTGVSTAGSGEQAGAVSAG